MSELVMEYTIESYIESLTGDTPREIAELVFQKVENFEHFMNEFWHKGGQAIFDLLTYREYLVRTENVTLDVFNKRCTEHSVCGAVTMTFYQPLPLSEIGFVNNRIKKTKISNESIYEQLSDNINLHLYKIIM